MMDRIHKFTFEDIHIGSALPLERPQVEHLAGMLNQTTPAADSALGGRTAVLPCQIEGVGPAVIKFYRRGGLISRFNSKTYLRLGKTRGQREYEMMEQVGRIGVRVPHPVAFAYRGLLFYQCWLITREVEHHRTLAELSRIEPQQAVRAAAAVADEINRMVQHRLHHVDLHPGNVLIDRRQRVYLIDFDKAGRTQISAEKLRNRYYRRWQRAVSKHQLPKTLTESMAAGLFPGA